MNLDLSGITLTEDGFIRGIEAMDPPPAGPWRLPYCDAGSRQLWRGS